MKKQATDAAAERLRKRWLAYEYPGRMVLRDIARLRKLFRRARAALMGHTPVRASDEERENHLWAERRE